MSQSFPQPPLPATESLAQYGTFLRTLCLEPATHYYEILLHQAQVPLLAAFAHLPEEALRNLIRQGLVDFFEQLETGTLVEKGREGLERWKNDQLAGLSRHQIQMPDIVLIYSLRRELFGHFLPQFTERVPTAIALATQLEQLYRQLELEAMEVFVSIQQQQLQSERDFLATIIDATEEGMLALDRDQKVTLWNHALEKRTGVKREQIMGQSILDYFPKNAGSEEAQAIQQSLQGETVYLRDVPIKSREGFFDMQTVPLRGPDGSVTGILSVTRDVTDHKRAAQALQLLNEEIRAQQEELTAANEDLHEQLARLEEAGQLLAENEARLREVQAIAHLGYYHYDEKQQILHWSEEMQAIFGIHPRFEDLAVDGYYSLVHADDRAAVQQQMQEAVEQGSAYTVEHRIYRPDGSIRWVLLQGQVFLSPDDGSLDRMSGTCLDITQRKEAELNAEAERYFIQRLTDISPDVISLYDLEAMRTLYSSREVYSILGYSPEELRQIQARGPEAFVDYFHPEDLPEIFHFLEAYKTYRGEAPRELEYRIRNAAGEWVYIADRYNVFRRNAEGLPTQIMGVARDVTARKKAEQQLKESRYLVERITETLPHVLYLYHMKENRNVYANRQLVTLLGYSIEAIQAMGPDFLPKIVHPEDWPLIGRAMAQLNTIPDGDLVEVEYRVQSASGEWRWFYDRANMFSRDPDGTVREVLGTSQDITVQKGAQQAIVQARDFYLTILEDFPALIWRSNLTMATDYFNRTWLTFTGRRLDQEKGDGWLEGVHPDDVAASKQTYTTAFATRQTFDVEYRLRRADGVYRWVMNIGKPLYDWEGTFLGYIGACFDVTESKDTQQTISRQNQELASALTELRRAQENLSELNNQLEERVQTRTDQLNASLRELTNTNAQLSRTNTDLDNFVYTASHDLKAPIANLEGLLGVLQRKISHRLTPEEQPLVGMLQGSVVKLKETLNGLIEVTKAQRNAEESVEVIDLADVFTEVLSDMEALLRASEAEVTWELAITQVRFARALVRSIVYNLLSNAIKYRSPERQPHVRLTTYSLDNYVVLCVTDNGLGMNAAQLSKLFTMFKRFHPQVEGTGIGLYIVKRTIENHHGRIEVESELGVGTTFRVYFQLHPQGEINPV